LCLVLVLVLFESSRRIQYVSVSNNKRVTLKVTKHTQTHQHNHESETKALHNRLGRINIHTVDIRKYPMRHILFSKQQHCIDDCA